MDVEIRVDRTLCIGSGHNALVDPRLVDVFQEDHTRIDEALDALSSLRADATRRGPAMRHLADTVDEHIRLEETVLFPAALAALSTRPSPLAASAEQPQDPSAATDRSPCAAYRGPTAPSEPWSASP